MTLLVLSDSHGRTDNVRAAIERAGKAEAILFLGDGLSDVSSLNTDIPICSVKGNCDAFYSLASDAPNELCLNFGDRKVLMMHGHTHSVKDGIERAVAYAALKGADILLYGHTHERYEEYIPSGRSFLGVTLEKPMWVLNPGSIGHPRCGGYSFGTLTIKNKDILLGFGNI